MTDPIYQLFTTKPFEIDKQYLEYPLCKPY